MAIRVIALRVTLENAVLLVRKSVDLSLSLSSIPRGVLREIGYFEAMK